MGGVVLLRLEGFFWIKTNKLITSIKKQHSVYITVYSFVKICHEWPRRLKANLTIKQYYNGSIFLNDFVFYMYFQNHHNQLIFWEILVNITNRLHIRKQVKNPCNFKNKLHEYKSRYFNY